MLKQYYENEKDIPEGVKEHYKKKGDRWVLEFDGADKIKEFRENNIALQQQLDDMKGEMEKFKDVDPEKYREYQKKLQKIQDRDLIAKGDYEELLAQNKRRWEREEAERLKPIQGTIESQKSEIAKLNDALAVYKIDHMVTSAFDDKKVKLQPGALPIVQRNAREIWRIVEGEAKPMDGDKRRLNRDGKDYTWDDFVNETIKKTPFLFEGNQGADADGGSGFPGGEGDFDTHGMELG